MSNNYIVLDVETTIKDGPGVGAVNPFNQLLYTYMHTPNGRCEVIGGELELSRYLDKFYEVDFVVAHNAKFEIQWLERAGLDTSKVLFFDTQIAEYVLLGNRKRPLDLNRVGQRYGCRAKEVYIDTLLANKECPSGYPGFLLHNRCKQDVHTTHEVFKQQRKLLKEDGLLPVVYTRCIFTPVVAEMEMRGMHLDKETVEQIHAEKVNEYETILAELDEITEGINMASPQQVADFIFNKLKFPLPKDRSGNIKVGRASSLFPDGTPSTDEDTIASLSPKNKRQARFLELKSRESKLRKAITSYTRKFKKACDEQDCMIWGNLNQTITVTHRLSSSNPNLQNIDRKLKKLFTARNKGWKIRQNDYDQLEFRVAGFLAGDETLRADVLNPKFDAHAQSATIIFGNDFLDAKGERRKEIRTEAKAHTFKPLYGGQSGTPNERAYYKAFLDRYTGVAEWHKDLEEEALNTKRMRTITGLLFYFPYVKYTESGYLEGNTAIKNYPVQMFATADIAPIGATMLWHRMRDTKVKSFLINTVHDSVIIEEHPDEDLGNLSEIAMSNDVLRYLKQVYNIDYDFPLTIESLAKDYWGS